MKGYNLIFTIDVLYLSLKERCTEAEGFTFIFEVE
jgi:hypothetical protein